MKTINETDYTPCIVVLNFEGIYEPIPLENDRTALYNGRRIGPVPDENITWIPKSVITEYNAALERLVEISETVARYESPQ